MPTIPLAVKLSPVGLVTVDPPLPNHPAIRSIVDDVVNKARYAFAVAAAGGDAPAGPGRIDRVFGEFLASRTPAARAEYQSTASQLLGAPQSTRVAHFGRFAAVEPHVFRTVGSDAIESVVGKMALDGAAVRKEAIALTDRTFQGLAPSGSKIKLDLPPVSVTAPHGKPLLSGLPKPDLADVHAGQAYKKLKLFVTRVACVEETDEVGSDEIVMGGSAVDTKGNTHMVGDFMVHDDFDKGEQIDLGFTRTFFTWDLATEPAGFPYVYGALLVVGEKDGGGFYKMLQKIWDIVNGEVRTLIAGALGALIGSILGGPFAAFGAIVGAAVGVFIDWLIHLLDNPDDLVQVKSITMTLTSTAKSYYDWAKLTSPQGWAKTLRFKGDGGIYDVDIAYRVFV